MFLMNLLMLFVCLSYLYVYGVKYEGSEHIARKQIYFKKVKNTEEILKGKEGYMLEESDANNFTYTIDLYLISTAIDINFYKSFKEYNISNNDDCVYEGKIISIETSSALISYCNGISGFVFDGEISFIIDENNFQNKNKIIAISSSAHDESFSSCDVNIEKTNEDLILNDMREKRVSRDTKNKNYHEKFSGFVVNGWMRYVEIFIIVDFEMFRQFRQDKASIIRRCNSILSVVNSIMRPLMIQTVLKGIEFVEWDEPDFRTKDHKKLLKNFSPKRIELLNEGKDHDYMLVLSGHDFYNNTVGYAYIGEMCKEKSVALVQHFPKEVSLAKVGLIVGHEMGHTLGVEHDGVHCGVKCSQHKCIMTSMGIHDPSWSNCSVIYIANKIDRFQCLKNPPTIMEGYPYCGNGRLDKGEQCDCGYPIECLNPCCDAQTCKLKPHAVCASGVCCDLETCSVHEAGKVCRRPASECDLPEFCTGTSEHCPTDVYKQNGYKCHNGMGTCFNGVCGSLDLLCKRLVGPSARYPEESYVRKTMRWYKSNPCKEVLCLTHLHLIDYESHQIIMMSEYHRVKIYPGLPLIKFGLEETDGLSCKSNMSCINKECRFLSPREVKSCPSECFNKGVCNSEGNCHCEVPYSPPNCLYPGYGGSVNSGLSTNPKDYTDHVKLIYLLFLAVIPILALILSFWPNIKNIYKEKYKSSWEKDCTCVSICLNGCCLPCMSFLNRWLCNFGSRSLSKVNDPKNNDLNSKDDIRKTICQVDMNIEPPETEVRSWGVASDALVTDVIVVTPKGSPTSSRKVRLPSSSPILRTKSYDNLSSDAGTDPKLKKSASKDSSHNFLDESGTQNQQKNKRTSFKSSMSSLISVFQRYGKQHSQSSEGDTASSTDSVIQDTPLREPNLRRIVIDPFSSLRNPSFNTKRPTYARSFSTDPKPFSQAPTQTLFPPVSSSHHASEQHLHLISQPKTPSHFKKDEKNSENKVSQTSISSSQLPKKALLPPKSKYEESAKNKWSDDVLTKKPLLPPKI